MEKEYIKALDGVRGFAAILVLYGHTPAILGDSPLGVIPVIAKSGVYLFFVLSAYLLSKQFMISRIDAGNLGQSLSKYFFRRTARILPLYFFACTVHYAVTVCVPGKSMIILDLGAYIKSIFLFEGYGHFWTIPLEYIFYFVLPVFALLGASYQRRYIALLTYSLFIVASVVAFDASLDYGLIPFMYIFVSGILLALLDVHWPNMKSRMCSCFISIAGVLAFVAFFTAYPIAQAFTSATHVEMANSRTLWTVVSFLVLSFAVFGSRFGRKFFELYPLRFMGMISFSAYIWHIFIYVMVKAVSPLAPTANYLVAWALTVIIGYVSYIVFEVKIYRSGLLARLWENSVGQYLR